VIRRPVHPPPPPPEPVLRLAERLYRAYEAEDVRLHNENERMPGQPRAVLVEWSMLTAGERAPWLAVAARAIVELAPPGGLGEKPIEVSLGTWKHSDGAWCTVRLVVPRRRIAGLVAPALKSKHHRAEIHGGDIVLLAERAAAEPPPTAGSEPAEIHAGAPT
jgi:hypothetical protein